ncbi:MAG: FGGY-family carbohydrate kinase [Lachnospiraceae bacterium]|nr:FGGY-family carbohydrate kinase [Lachnospiraceae bacterium]
MENTRELIESGKAVLGIEFGSTRIKAVLIDREFKPVASGDFTWENSLDNGIWTYPMDEVLTGLRECYAALKKDVLTQYGVTLKNLAAIGISGMMHGYLAFDKEGKLLVPFRTWRNTITGEACAKLSEAFRFNVPQRWTVAHVYQAMLSKEPHVKDVDRVYTLAGYVHYLLTGERVAGVGEASGMFPIDPATNDYDAAMADKFLELAKEAGYPYDIRDLFPKVLSAGDPAGVLTEEGARLLDPSGDLEAGIPLCPPEGDAGTGMAATNSVRIRTGNVSAGTSVFSMVVLEKPLKSYYEEIDIVTTPVGAPVAMVHCNNCTSDLNAWVQLFKESLDLLGVPVRMDTLYETLYTNALHGAPDCGGVMAYNYVSGEAITGIPEGRPMLVRTQEADFSLANFMRAHLYSAFATLKLGNDILSREEQVTVDTLYGHGGIFRTKGVAQQFLADALHAPVSVMETAGEGGPWGMALLASYMVNKEDNESLPDFLSDKVFRDSVGSTLAPTEEGMRGFDEFAAKYKAGLKAERAAVETL